MFKTIRQDVERKILAKGLIKVIEEAVESYQRRWGLMVVPEFVKFILSARKTKIISNLSFIATWLFNKNNQRNTLAQSVGILSSNHENFNCRLPILKWNFKPLYQVCYVLKNLNHLGYQKREEEYKWKERNLLENYCVAFINLIRRIWDNGQLRMSSYEDRKRARGFYLYNILKVHGKAQRWLSYPTKPQSKSQKLLLLMNDTFYFIIHRFKFFFTFHKYYKAWEKLK